MFMVLVHGPSMAPTLRHGDVLLVRRGGRRVRAGDLVVARFASRPELLVVKRAVRPEGDRWWVRSDNQLTTDDSRGYGAAEVIGRAVCRLRPRPAWLSRLPVPPGPGGSLGPGGPGGPGGPDAGA